MKMKNDCAHTHIKQAAIGIDNATNSEYKIMQCWNCREKFIIPILKTLDAITGRSKVKCDCDYNLDDHPEKNIINFKDISDDIVSALKERSEKLEILEDVFLIDGFFNPSVHPSISDSFRIGGPSVPMIFCCGEITARIYLFSLYALLPNLKK